jgi:F-type H+-transporting ATPase subunit g
MRGAVRPTLRATRAATQRFASSQSSSPLQNPNVQKAVEGAQKAYEQGAATVKRVAGPLGARVGNALGCESP